MAINTLSAAAENSNVSRRSFVKSGAALAAVPVVTFAPAISSAHATQTAETPMTELYRQFVAADKRKVAAYAATPVEVDPPEGEAAIVEQANIARVVSTTPCQNVLDLALKASMIHIVDDLFDEAVASSFAVDFKRIITPLNI